VQSKTPARENFPWLANKSILAASYRKGSGSVQHREIARRLKEIATGHEHPWPIVNQQASCKFSKAHKDLIIHETKF